MSVDESWSHSRVDVGGLELHCVTQGRGPLVVMLHGFPECWYSWRRQIPSLASRFKVVAPDMRGYNESDKPAGVSEYRMAKLTADIKGLVEALGEKKAHLVGHDWGGVVAWSLAMEYPALVDRLVVMNAPHPAAFARQILSNPRQTRRSAYMFFFQLPAVPEMALRAFDCALLKRTFTGWMINKDAITSEDLEQYARCASVPGALTGGLNYYRAMLRNVGALKALRGEVPPIKNPTLLIWAEEDRALGKELTYGLGRYFEGPLTIRYIPDCSHWVQQEQPLLVNELLDEFL